MTGGPVALGESAPARPGPSARALLEATRPKQWAKNVLVAAAPLAAGDLHHGAVIRHTLVAFVVFLLGSCGTYLVNDAHDAQFDRVHEVKRNRPIARGAVTVTTAVSTAAVLMVGSLTLAAVFGNRNLTICLATYLVLAQAYTLRLKDEPVLDLAIVASGFLLRAIAGGLAADIALSKWFLTVAGFGSLFVVAGKRYSELVAFGEGAERVRKAHASYTATYLRFVWTSAAAVLLTTYCLWAFEVAAKAKSATAPWAAISVAPFVIGVLRYARDVDLGQAGEPEEIMLRDRGLQCVGLVWLVVFALGAVHA
jgi:decaprenyl-phosphate phosphoribosyltransferase